MFSLNLKTLVINDACVDHVGLSPEGRMDHIYPNSGVLSFIPILPNKVVKVIAEQPLYNRSLSFYLDQVTIPRFIECLDLKKEIQSFSLKGKTFISCLLLETLSLPTILMLFEQPLVKVSFYFNYKNIEPVIEFLRGLKNEAN